MYLIKWRAYYVTYYTKEAVASWLIEDVKWAYQEGNENLKISKKSCFSFLNKIIMSMEKPVGLQFNQPGGEFQE